MVQTPRDNFLEASHVAVVGASNNPRKFGYTVYTTLRRKGVPVIPINPKTEEVDTDRCFPSISASGKHPEAAVFVVKPEIASELIDDAVVAGVSRIWFQQGDDFSTAARNAKEAGIETVTGRCILMYAQPVTGIHGFHRFLSKLFKKL